MCFIEHIAENYCEADVDSRVTLINSHDIRDSLIDVANS